MKNHIPNWFIISAVLIFIISAFFTFISFDEYYTVAILKQTSEYPFGSEGPVAGTWQYENESNYSLYNLISGLFYAVVMLLTLIAFVKRNLKLMRFGIICFLLTFVILFIIQENYFKIW